MVSSNAWRLHNLRTSARRWIFLFVRGIFVTRNKAQLWMVSRWMGGWFSKKMRLEGSRFRLRMEGGGKRRGGRGLEKRKSSEQGQRTNHRGSAIVNLGYVSFVSRNSGFNNTPGTDRRKLLFGYAQLSPVGQSHFLHRAPPLSVQFLWR